MKSNTVVLDLNCYLELKEFKEKIEKEYIKINIYCYNSYRNSNTEYLTKDETVIKLGKQIDQLNKELYDLKSLEIDLMRKSEGIKEDLKDFKYKIKRLSIWEFIKYKIDKLEL